MILFISGGRLGNQLFQYSFLNTISKDNEKILTIHMEQFVDKFLIKNNKFHHIHVSDYTFRFIRKAFKPLILKPLIKIKLIGYIKQNKNNVSDLNTFSHKKGILPITLVETDNFQSEDFFESSKADFKIKDNFIDNAKKFLNEIESSKTKVFIHIRRTDYMFVNYLGTYGINLPKEYYMNAINEISKEVIDPIFIFLSDDPEFVKYCYFNVPNKIISKNDMATDLAIMSLCDYGIISNSTFSWWGAYLMQNRKKVYFPKYWYGWKQKIQSHKGIYPRWAKILETKDL